MRILALETSSLHGSVAALQDDRVLGQTVLDPRQRTAQSFAPAMLQQLAAVGWQPQDIQLVAVTVGPGSFTGLRIGVTAAKTLAYAVGAEVIGLNTLAVIAGQAPAGWPEVAAVLDAQRQQLFAARFRPDGPRWATVRETEVVDQAQWLAALRPGWAVTGPGLERLREPLPPGVVVVDRAAWVPQAASVGRLGYLAYQAGTRDDLWTLTPQYYRPSAAEEVWEAKQRGPNA